MIGATEIAAIALLKFAIGQLAALVVTTGRTLKAFGPPPSIKRIEALGFGTVLLDKIA